MKFTSKELLQEKARSHLLYIPAEIYFGKLNTNFERCSSCTHRNNEPHTMCKCNSLLFFCLNIDSTWQQEDCHSPLLPMRWPLTVRHIDSTRTPIQHLSLTHTSLFTSTLPALFPQAITPSATFNTFKKHLSDSCSLCQLA